MNLVTLLLGRFRGAWPWRRRLGPSNEKSDSDWARAVRDSVRAPARHRDLELSDKAKRWLSKLPGDAQPTELSRRCPRIVNRIAALWKDEGLTECTFAELFTDTRGTRQGFPPSVLQELDVLYELHVMRADSLSGTVGKSQIPAGRTSKEESAQIEHA